jgi:flagellar hook assembly protein FlgD
MVDESYDYGATTIDNLSNGVNRFTLRQNYPNPVRHKTSISFQLPNNGHVLVEVLNDNGNVIDVLVNSQLNDGSHSVLWDSSNYPSGLYFYRVQYGDFAKSRKMLVFH